MRTFFTNPTKSSRVSYTRPRFFTPFFIIDPANNFTGEVTSIIRIWTRAYDSKMYDLAVGPSNTCVLINRSNRANWIDTATENGGVVTWLGPIRAGFDEERIVADAGMQLEFMGKYDYLSNNCYTFVERMYKVEKEL